MTEVHQNGKIDSESETARRRGKNNNEREFEELYYEMAKGATVRERE